MPPSLTKISGNSNTIEEFIRELEDTTATVTRLLTEVRRTSEEFIGIKIRFDNLCEELEQLSELIKDNKDGSGLLMRVVLLEKEIKNIENNLTKKEEIVKTQQQSMANIEVAEKAGKWQFRVALATGILALCASTISTLVSLLK